MNMDDPAYVAIIQARIAICFSTDAAMIRRVMATHIKEAPSVEKVALEGDTLLYNHDYVAKSARVVGGRAVLIADITDLFRENNNA